MEIPGHFSAEIYTYADATGQDRHSVLIDYDAFVRVFPPDRTDPTRIYQPDDFDFHLKRQSRAIDAGVALPNVTDAYVGRGPDLGALEAGQQIQYGPRD